MENIGSTTESIPLASQNGTYRLRILIVDDDETDRLAVRRCLHNSGMSVAVDEAGSAAEALKLIGSSAYDCVLLDYYLPDVSELSLFERLRAAAPDLPVVMFTGRGDEDIAVKLMKAGAADYLPKASITPERLAAGLRHAVELTRATAARKQAEHELRAEESRSSHQQGGDLPWGLSVCTRINVLPHVGQRGSARASVGSMRCRW